MKRIKRENRVCVVSGCTAIFECKINSKRKYCSRSCGGHTMEGKVSPNKGKIFAEREIRFCGCGCGYSKIVSKSFTWKWKRGHWVGDPEKKKTANKKRQKSMLGKNSRRTKELWQDPEFVKKQMKARHVSPNKAEIFLSGFFQSLFPNEYKFVGDGQFILAGKCPDFININGQKKIIELFGEHVHKPEEEQQRIDLFEQYGYQTLIIWYSELQNLDLVKQKILEFHEA